MKRRSYNKMLKEVRADIAKIEPQILALKDAERGLVKLKHHKNRTSEREKNDESLGHSN